MAAEPRPSVWRNARRVTEVRGEVLSDAGRASEPGCLSLCMLWSMSANGAASSANQRSAKQRRSGVLQLFPIRPPETLPLPFGRVLRALLSKVEPITPPGETSRQRRQPLASANGREAHRYRVTHRRQNSRTNLSMLPAPAVWGVHPITEASVDGLRSRVRLRTTMRVHDTAAP